MLRANWIELRHSAELINRESVPVVGALFRAALGLLLLTATDVSTTCAVVEVQSTFALDTTSQLDKIGCISPRTAAFRIDSGQLRFAMMRNLTVILRVSCACFRSN